MRATLRLGNEVKTIEIEPDMAKYLEDRIDLGKEVTMYGWKVVEVY